MMETINEKNESPLLTNVKFYKKCKLIKDPNYEVNGKDEFGNECYTDLVLEEPIEIANQPTTFETLQEYSTYVNDNLIESFKDNNKICVTFDYNNGNKTQTYKGEIDKKGNINGIAMCNYPNKNLYIGEYKCDTGTLEKVQGTFYHNGDKYVGEWKNNKKSGNGTMLYKNGNKYSGAWECDTKTNGSFICNDGSVIKTTKQKNSLINYTKYTLNGVDVTHICGQDGDFNKYGSIAWINGNGDEVTYLAKWKNNKVVIDDKYTTTLKINDLKDKKEHQYGDINIPLNRKGITNKPPKRLFSIPYTSKDILWTTCCNFVCAEDLKEQNTIIIPQNYQK